jgi:hypothetical protein
MAALCEPGRGLTGEGNMTYFRTMLFVVYRYRRDFAPHAVVAVLLWALAVVVGGLG